jgi:hypothetical protein
LQYWPPYSGFRLGQQPGAAVVGQQLGVSAFAQQSGVPALGQQAGVSVPGQHGDDVFASFIIQLVSLVSAAFNAHVLLFAQGVLNGHKPAAPPQDKPFPFIKTECAAKAQAAMITITNIAVFRFFRPPESDEQHLPPSSCFVISSFVSIFFPQKKHF